MKKENNITLFDIVKNPLTGVKSALTDEVIKYTKSIVKEKFTVNKEFNINSVQHDLFCKWLFEKNPKKYKAHSVKPNMKKYESFETSISRFTEPFIAKVSQSGYVKVSIEKDEALIDDNNIMCRVSFFGKDAYRNVIQVDKLVKEYYSSNEVVRIFDYNMAQSYGDFTRKMQNKRSLNTLFYDNNIKENLVNYITQWQNNGKLFDERGIVHKAGILLHGPAGTGKTNLVKAIASEFNMDIHLVKLTDIEKTITNINNLYNGQCPKVAIMLLEDFDIIFAGSDKDKNVDERENINKLMQILDGISSLSNTIMIATTNHIDKFYENEDRQNLIRDGRFDLKINIDNASKETALTMINSFSELLPAISTDKSLRKYILDEAKVVYEDGTVKYNQTTIQSTIIKKLYTDMSY